MVRLFVAVTDKSWFDQLSASAPHDEVNFWQPSGTTQFRALQPGELFLFKLHAPNNFIVGGGIFGHASIAPLCLAWDAFGLNNGVSGRCLSARGYCGGSSKLLSCSELEGEHGVPELPKCQSGWPPILWELWRAAAAVLWRLRS
jgi:hypothetical protein